MQGDPVDGSGKSAPSAGSGDALEAGDRAVTPGAPPAAAAVGRFFRSDWTLGVASVVGVVLWVVWAFLEVTA